MRTTIHRISPKLLWVDLCVAYLDSLTLKKKSRIWQLHENRHFVLNSNHLKAIDWKKHGFCKNNRWGAVGFGCKEVASLLAIEEVFSLDVVHMFNVFLVFKVAPILGFLDFSSFISWRRGFLSRTLCITCFEEGQELVLYPLLPSEGSPTPSSSVSCLF